MEITKNNISEVKVDKNKIWNSLIGFAKYAFNKSHAVFYSIIAYKTAEKWLYKRDEYLEYSLNYDTKKRYQQAIDKCKELGMNFVYPTLNNMKGNLFKVSDNHVYIPGEANNNYNSYVDFMYGDHDEKVSTLIYKGVCDHLTKDRFALSELATTILSKFKEEALYMEPEGIYFKSLKEILNGLKATGAVTDFKNVSSDEEGYGILVSVKRGRGADSKILFHDNNSDYCKSNIVKYDLKYFGAVRPGVLSDEPFINTTGIIRTLEKIKENYKSRGKDQYIYKALKDELDNYMFKYFSNDYRKTFINIYALMTDFIVYERSVKVFLNFNDKNDFFYIYDNEVISEVKKANKKSLVKLTMIYSPFINKRKEEFVYDFDIEKFEIISKN